MLAPPLLGGAAVGDHNGTMSQVRSGREEWPIEREGYDDVRRPAHALTARFDPVPAVVRLEEYLGSLIAGGAAVWAAWAATINGVDPVALINDPRPVELLGVGILVWLHAKWRRATLTK